MIETERLTLHPLPAVLVARLVEGDVAAAQALALPYEITEETFADDAGVLARRHTQLTADPTQEPWLLHAAVLRGSRQVAGRIGFHAPPDEHGVVEVGYSVAPNHRKQGLATEMVAGMLGWAAEQGAVACLASVSPDNVASLATVKRLGFVKVGEQIDEEDGLEWVHRRDLR
ncbi:MAG TPA: GNAT family N-acetyltransferase [Mycobacteriales bacterium]|nr:GNAT family N-acetyltransferase [Mycobacteriales bacterium]